MFGLKDSNIKENSLIKHLCTLHQNEKFVRASFFYYKIYKITRYRYISTYALPLLMRMCIPNESHLWSLWGFTFPVRMFILLWFILPENAHSSLLMRMCLTRNGDVPGQESTPSPAMGMLIATNTYPCQECT